MDWVAIINWDSFFSAAGGTACVLAAAYWVLNKWLGKHIEKTVELKYDKELEEHKASLQKQVNHSVQEMQAVAEGIREKKEADRKLFNEFISEFPSDSGTIYNLSDFSEYGQETFDPKLFIKALHEYNQKRENPEKIFHDEIIEEKRQKFINDVREFLNFSFYNTVGSFKKHGFKTVMRNEDIELTDADYNALERLRDLGENIISAHKDFVKTGRDRLDC